MTADPDHPTFAALRRGAERDGHLLLALAAADGDAVAAALSSVRAWDRRPGRAGVAVGPPSAVLSQLARSLAAELGPAGVRFNAVALHPGATAADAADPILFLLGPDAGYVTGATLDVGTAPASDAR